jgi:hypothetical protein
MTNSKVTQSAVDRNTLPQCPAPARSRHERDLQSRNARLERYVARLLEERVEGCPNCGHVRIERAQ